MTGGALSGAKAIPRQGSRASLLSGTCQSPDQKSLALTKELSEINLEDMAIQPRARTRTVSFHETSSENSPILANLAAASKSEQSNGLKPMTDNRNGQVNGENPIAMDRKGSPPVNRLVPNAMSFADLTKDLEKDVEDHYGEAHPTRDVVRNARRIVVKVGTAVVTRGKDHRLALGRLGSLVEQLEALVRSGRQVILVTSGGVGVGRQKLMQQRVLNSSPLELQMAVEGRSSIASRAAAAAGQSGLMALYDNLFGLMDLQSAQLLVTSNDFTEPTFKENLCATVEDLLSMSVVPVFNENDAISKGAAIPPEIARQTFTDNDGLAALLAVELNADLLMLMTDVPGVYTGPPKDPKSQLIATYCPDIHDGIVKFGDKSLGGRGGMVAKINAAQRAADQGVTVVIASGKGGDCLVQAVAGQMVGTMFNSEAAVRLAAKHRAMQEEAVSKNLHRASSSSVRTLTGQDDARSMALGARDASRKLQCLSSQQREDLLNEIASALEARVEHIMQANERDLKRAEESKTDDNLKQRLALKPEKLRNVCRGIRSIANQEEPIGKIQPRQSLSNGQDLMIETAYKRDSSVKIEVLMTPELLRKTELAADLILEKVTSPIGVLLIIFEARPEALPQIAALAIRSGNGLLLKGGKEAAHSNALLHKIITDTIARVAPDVGPELVGLVTSRQGVDDLLQLDDVIDLVIPRGSNKLVSYILNHTRIPVMGHADGVCHMYIDPTANIQLACKLAVDSKTDYPAACNALETLLVHRALTENGGIFKLTGALNEAGVKIYGGERAAKSLGLAPACEPKHEYGTKEITLEIVDSMEQAIDHIHEFGSGHTEAIVTGDQSMGEEFLRRVDSACIHVNASTRFSDGFRYGLGAEVGISTGRIHARGPVGVEGLLTTRYLLRGNGQTVEKDSKIQYTHRQIA